MRTLQRATAVAASPVSICELARGPKSQHTGLLLAEALNTLRGSHVGLLNGQNDFVVERSLKLVGGNSVWSISQNAVR